MGRGRTRRVLSAAVLGLIGAVLAFGGVHTSAAVAPHTYLALGDSITFGYVAYPPAADGTNPFADADNFVAYPSYVGAALRLQTVDAACPGESTASMITLGAPDAGCTSYRSAYPLHTSYPNLSQLDFADAFLAANTSARLVTIAIGINDVLIAIGRCGGADQTACIGQHLPQVLATVRANLVIIVHNLRATGYREAIVLVNYYALEYANAQTTGIIRALDASIATVGAAEHLPVANSFDAFKNATASTHGDGCAAGLFGPGPSTLGPCDLHPDAAGQHMLASAVERAVRLIPEPTSQTRRGRA